MTNPPARLLLLLATTLGMVAPAAAQSPSRSLPVAVFNFEVSGDAPASLGSKLAALVAADLSCLPPFAAVSRDRLGDQPGLPRPNLEDPLGPEGAARLGQQLGATALVTGRIVVSNLGIQLIAKITDAESGRVYGQMVQGALTPHCYDLASDLSQKIADLMIRLRGLPAANWSPATLHRVLGGDSVWAQPPVAAIDVDGKRAAADGDLSLAPGAHEILVNYSYDGGFLRAGFQVEAVAGARYQVMFHALADDQLSLWIANTDTLRPVTTAIDRNWIPGDDLPLVSVARYPLPESRFNCSAVADDQAIYLVEGKRWQELQGPLGSMSSQIEHLTDIVRFDLKTHESRTLARSVGRREFQDAVLADGKIYILGPEDSFSSRSHSMAIYNLATQQLSFGPAMPRVVSSFGTALINRRIYVAGGWSPDPALRSSDAHPATNAVDYFDLATQSWFPVAPMPVSAEGKAVPLAGGIVFAGGLVGRGSRGDDQQTVFVLRMKMPRLLSSRNSGGRPSPRPGDDTASTEAAVARVEHDTEIQTVQFLNCETGTWSFLTPLPAAVPTRAVAVLENRLFIFDDRDDSVQIYDPTSGHASTFHLAANRPGSTAVTVGNQLYLVGAVDPRDGASITAFRLNPNWARDVEEARPLHSPGVGATDFTPKAAINSPAIPADHARAG